MKIIPVIASTATAASFVSGSAHTTSTALEPTRTESTAYPDMEFGSAAHQPVSAAVQTNDVAASDTAFTDVTRAAALDTETNMNDEIGATKKEGQRGSSGETDDAQARSETKSTGVDWDRALWATCASLGALSAGILTYRFMESKKREMEEEKRQGRYKHY